MGKKFHIGTVLSISTTIHVDPNGFHAIHEAFEYLAGGPIWTHELAYYWDEFSAEVIRQHPQLEGVDASGLDEHSLPRWISQQSKRFGQELELEPFDFKRKKSVMECAQEMAPNAKHIAVVVDDEGR